MLESFKWTIQGPINVRKLDGYVHIYADAGEEYKYCSEPAWVGTMINFEESMVYDSAVAFDGDRGAFEEATDMSNYVGTYPAATKLGELEERAIAHLKLKEALITNAHKGTTHKQ